MFSDDDLLRYHRQMIIDGWGVQGQEKLKRSVVFVAGAGGLGCAAMIYLVCAGVGTLRICDCDIVELSNLNRQFLHSHKDIGLSKVVSAEKALYKVNQKTTIVTLNRKIDRSSAKTLIRGTDLILDCLDNWETRFVLNEAAVSLRIPMIHAGVSGFRGNLAFLSPPETPCLACFYRHSTPKSIPPIVGCTAGTLGAIQATEALKFLTGIGRVLKNHLLFFDGIHMKLEEMELQKNPDCPVCGRM